MNNITAKDFGLPEVENEFSYDFLPFQIRINDEVVAELIKYELIEKSTVKITYNYIVPNPINFINLNFTL